MKNMKKVLSLLLALMLVFSLAACSSGGDNSSNDNNDDAAGDDAASGETTGADLDLTIGYVTISGSAPWGGTALGNALQAECDSRGWKLNVLDAETDADKINEHVQTMIDHNVDVIMIFGGDPTANADNAKKASEAGIPVFLAALDVVEEGREYAVACVGPDQEQMCYDIGQYMIENDGGADADNLVVQISGVPFLQDYIDREAGFARAMKETSWDVKEAQYAYSDRAAGKSYMEQFIQAYGDDIDILMGYDDDFTMGAVAAIEEAGMTGQISVYSITGQNDAIQAVKDGQMTLCVMNRADGIMAEMAVAIEEYFIDGKTEYFHYTDLTYITAENVDDYIGKGEF